jgi:hypothetical protein
VFFGSTNPLGGKVTASSTCTVPVPTNNLVDPIGAQAPVQLNVPLAAQLNLPVAAAALVGRNATATFPFRQQYEHNSHTAADGLHGITKVTPRKNLTHAGFTYNCNKYTKCKISGDFTNYYSCIMVHHEDDNTWKRKRQTKDKVDDGKTKCGGTLIVHYTQLSGCTTFKLNRKHKCNNE